MVTVIFLRLSVVLSLSWLAWIPCSCGTQNHCLNKGVWRWAPWLTHCFGISPAIGRLVLLNLQSSTSWPGFWKLLTVCFYLCLLVSLGPFILHCNKFVLSSSHSPWTLGHYEVKDETSCVWEIACFVSLWEVGLRLVSDDQISPDY